MSRHLTPTEAAVAAANEFKSMLDRLPTDTPFLPGRKVRLFDSACYAEACSLLQQALPQVSQAPQCVGDERWVVLPLPSVVPNQGANVPANQLEFFAGVTVTIAQLAFQIVEECRGSGEDSGLLEIGARLRRKVDLAGEQVESKRNTVHEAALKEVVGQTLCHGQALVDRLMNAAFNRPREPRSDAYKNGVRAVLTFRAGTTFDITAPYATGSAERDAFIAGMEEGREVWRSQMRKEEA